MLSSIHGLTNKDESEQPMHTIKKLFVNTLIIYCTLWGSVNYLRIADASAIRDPLPIKEQQALSRQITADQADRSILNSVSSKQFDYRQIQFKHGDISWLPALAEQAGWPENTWKKLGRIILRESGGCPNRRGGDAVDKNCNITHVTEWNHRSDTGLLQINGVNYDTSRNKWAAVCRELDICTQEPLLDPLNNLKAGKVLYDLSGWAPWDPCTWGPEWAHRCPKDKLVKDDN